MNPEPQRDPASANGWLGGLLQKRVFQTLAIYVAIAWGGTEIMLAVQETFGLPDWVSRLVMAFFIAGAPVAVFLGWARDLQSLAARAALTALAVVFFCLGAWLVYTQGSKPGPPDSSVAILPFSNLNVADEQAWLVNAITEDLRNQLGQSSGLLMIASGSSENFRDRADQLDEIRERLNVRYVLDGNVRQINNGLRVNVNLTDTIEGKTQWSDRIEVPAHDLLTVAERIVDRIAGVLEVQISTHAMAGSTRSIEAWENFRRGYESPDSVTRRGHFEEAIAQDPDFALPMVYLAADYFGEFEQGFLDFDSAMHGAAPWLERAEPISAELAEYQLVMGWFAVGDERAHDAERYYQRAIELNPNLALAYGSYGLLMRWALDRPDEALRLHRRNVEIDPLDCTANLQFGTSLWVAGQYEQAESQYESSIGICPENQMLYESYSAMFAARLGRLDRALDIIYRGFATISDPPTPRLLATAARWHKNLADENTLAHYLRALEQEHPDAPAIASLAAPAAAWFLTDERSLQQISQQLESEDQNRPGQATADPGLCEPLKELRESRMPEEFPPFLEDLSGRACKEQKRQRDSVRKNFESGKYQLPGPVQRHLPN